MEKSKLIEDNMKLVYYLINRHYPTYLHNEDVIQEGMVGLCKAVESYDESKGKLGAYAAKCILNEIRMYFRTNRKHSDVLSYDREIKDEDGDSIAMIDTITGDEDIDFSYIKYSEFYDSLNETDKLILSLRTEHTIDEIGEIAGYTKKNVSKRLLAMKRKWRKFYGSD